jgi:nitrate/TMAO reductase-like tetraheme cytochrome c subunit
MREEVAEPQGRNTPLALAGGDKKEESSMLHKSRTGSLVRMGRWTASDYAALLASGVMLLLILQFVPGATSIAAETASDGDAKCLACHSMKLKKSLGNGENLSLQVPVAKYTESVHSNFGCTSCHQDIGNRRHPKTRAVIDNKRDYAVLQNQSCRNCHAANFEQYEGSIHARLIADGNQAAPLCADCHSAHAIKSLAVYEPLAGQPCKTCHERIFEAYSQSVHSEARASGNVIPAGDIRAPICTDCHRAHKIAAVAASERLQSTCLSCHEGVGLAHRDWLPNAGLHLDVVACAACHAPMAERRIDLQLYDNLTKAPVGLYGSQAVSQELLSEIDAAGDGLDPKELWHLVRQASQEGKAADISLRGRLEVSTGVEAHRLASKASAVRDCQSCHQYGADAFQAVTISIVRPDGRKRRYQADSEVLNSLVSTDSFSSFYTLSGTRTGWLDGLLILALVGGLAIPLGHMIIGRYLKEKR